MHCTALSKQVLVEVNSGYKHCWFARDVTVAMLVIKGAFHLVKISGISGSAVNGTRFVGSSHWKIPRKSGKSKEVGPFSQLEFPNGMSCSIYVSRSLYQFQVHGRAPPRTGVYDQMQQLFTNRKFHFCYHRNFRFFLLNGKRPKKKALLSTGNLIPFYVNSSRKKSIVLTPNMVALSCGCNPRIQL